MNCALESSNNGRSNIAEQCRRMFQTVSDRCTLRISEFLAIFPQLIVMSSELFSVSDHVKKAQEAVGKLQIAMGSACMVHLAIEVPISEVGRRVRCRSDSEDSIRPCIVPIFSPTLLYAMDKNNVGSTFVGSLLLHRSSAARDACFEKDNSVAT